MSCVDTVCDTVTIEEAICTREKKKMDVTFEKVGPLPVDLVQAVDGEDTRVTLPDYPIRRTRNPSTADVSRGELPPNLRVKLGSYLGRGRSGMVFELNYCDPHLSGSFNSSNMPALAVKFGVRGYNKWLLREKWFYDEMQTLQGEAIPWCYGLYSANIDPRLPFLPWVRGNNHRELKDGKDWKLEKWLQNRRSFNWMARVGAWKRNPEDVKNDQLVLEDQGDFAESHADIVEKFEEKRMNVDENKDIDDYDDSDEEIVKDIDSIPVLILIVERLGNEYLPIGGVNRPFGEPIPEEVTKDVYDAYDMMSRLGIYHNDIKYTNILEARPGSDDKAEPETPEGEIVTSDIGDQRRRLKCRVIDFEISRKTNMTPKVIFDDDSSWLERLIKGLPNGHVLGEHDR